MKERNESDTETMEQIIIFKLQMQKLNEMGRMEMTLSLLDDKKSLKNVEISEKWGIFFFPPLVTSFLLGFEGTLIFILL